MSLSKYPERLDLFQTKKNAQFDGDPNGDFVMAEDINQLQDAVTAIEKSLGVKPQGSKISVGERITLLEGSASLRVPSILIYLGVPSKINESETTLEAAGHFSKYDHVVLGNDAQDPSDPDYALTQEIIDLTTSSRGVKFYGYIDCGVNSLNLSLSEIQVAIQQWKDMDAVGIYCANFGYEDRVSRARQNLILDSIHQHDMVAILDGQDPEELFTDLFHETLNPDWVEPNIKDGDIYHYYGYALDTSKPEVFEPNVPAVIMNLIKLYEYRVEKGIRVFATPVIQTNVDAETAQRYYDYAHVSALVTSMDAFHPVIEGYGAGTHTAPTYNWVPIAGNWYSASPRIEYDDAGIIATREMPFGRIILNTLEHTYSYEGLYIPYELLKIAANTIEGNLLKDNTVEDKKIKNYKGSRLIDAINADTEKLININKIMKFGYGDISGSISVDALSANVINAINANIGHATIGSAVIGDLTAGHIKAGTIDAERITASVVEAINLYAKNLTADSAVIDTALIRDLTADKITAGDINAERIKAGVIEAINLSAQQGYIQNLNADNITAGNIKAERIWSEVVNALNLYAENMVVGSAKIDSASIGDLTAGHIRGSVIEAINLNADSAKINNAHISELTADHIKASVFEAIEANIKNAKIDQAHIGDLSADKITAGDIDADRIKAHVIDAINLYAKDLTADSARLDTAIIKDLNADKITAGDINTERLKANIVEALNLYAKEMSAESATIDVAAIGALEVKHMEAAVIEAINASIENAEIDAAKIGSLKAENIQAEVIKAINASIEEAVINQAQIGDLDAKKITAGTLDAEIIKGSVISAINGSFEDLKVQAAKIGVLDADHMKAGVIEAINGSFENLKVDSGKIGTLAVDNLKANVVEAINASIQSATIDAAKIKSLTADHIKAVVMEAINARITNATIDKAVIGDLHVDNMKGQVVEAVNSYTGLAVIGEAKIGDLSAGKIKTGTLDAERIKASVVEAINASIDELNATHATIDAAAIGSLKAENIEAEVIKAINASIESAKINAAQIGQLTAGHIRASVIEAINGHIQSATIDSAKIGELTADKISGAVIAALEANIGTATINEALIGSLHASKINAGDIAADRLRATVVNAINASIDELNATHAKIDAAAIKALTADHIKATVIDAINANIDIAQINKAIIPDLDAGHIQAEVIKAINANIGKAEIDEAIIPELTVRHIKGEVVNAINANIGEAKIDRAIIPELDAKHIEAKVIDAINTNITGRAVINEASIGDLSASKITSGNIDTERLKATVVEAINASIDELNATHATIEAAAIGELKAENIQAEIIKAVNASIENATIESAKIGTLEASKMRANVIEAINGHIRNATIDGAKIGELTVDNMKAAVVDAIKLYAGEAKIESAKIEDLDASKIVSGSIDTNLLTANVVKAINSEFQNTKINSAKIAELTAGHIEAEVIKAINSEIQTATINAARIGALTVDNLKAAVVSAINASIETAQIKSAMIEDLNASKIVAGDINAARLTANVVSAINSEIQTAKINQAKIGDLDAEKITAGNIGADRMTANIVTAINAYADTMEVGEAVISSAAIDVLQTKHMQAAVIDAINASLGNAKINNAKIDTLTAGHITASVIEAINANLNKATIKEGVIEDLSAEKIATGSLKAEVMEANVVHAINGDFENATIQAAKIGELTADHIKAEVVAAINGHFDSATIDGAKIGELEVESMKAGVISAVNGSFENLTIDAARIGSLKAENIQAEIVKAINATIETAKIGAAKIDKLTADHINASVIQAVNASIENIKINQAKIGQLKAENLEADSVTANAIKSNEIQTRHIAVGQINAQHIMSNEIISRHIKAGEINANHITTAGLDATIIKTGYLDANRIRTGSIEAMKLVAGSITGREIAANTLTSREIAAGSITADEIQAGSITATHITTKGLDAQQVNVYNSKTGETLIGGGYLRVDGLDAGVVQSDNLAANGMFMTASSSFGIKRMNPAGEVIIGTESQVPGGNQIWKYDLETGELVTTIDVPGKKPAFIAIDGLQKYAYVTVQGNDTLIQLDLDFDTITENSRPMGKAPTKVKFTGNLLGDMKHLFVVNTDKTDLNAPDSFYVLDVPPHSDFSQLYIHHQLVTGNTPYDFVVSEKDKKIYITLADQGDIMVIEASNMQHTYKWKMVGAIPISPYGTDNYHGGLTAGFGIGTAVGGDSSAEYNLDHGHGGHGGHAHGHGGYSVSDGTMKEYKPHGIAIETKENLLVVTEVEQNELVVINRVEEHHFEWPEHKDYTTHKDWIASVVVALDKYDNNPELARADGYNMASPFVKHMGYHFVNTAPEAFNPEVPNTLMYIFDTTVNQYKLIGAEWTVPDSNIPSPVPGRDWEMAQPSMARYADGLVIVGVSQEETPLTHPETGSALVGWSPAIYGIHFYHKVSNPLGLFESFNPKLDPYNATNPMFPPGFESMVDPNMADSNYHEYIAPDSGGHGGHGGHHDGGHAHSVESEEPMFETMAGDHGGHDGHGGHGGTGGPDTTGQGLVWKYVRHRIPIGDNPENIVIAHGKVWVTLMGTNKVAVMNESDLYRTSTDFEHGKKWSDFVRYIEVGSKPLDMIPDHERMKLYVTVNADNRIAVIDMMTEQVLEHWTAGANVMSGDITPDGKYLYITNNGGVGELSFVYPEGQYIGDAFIGLEGDVQYQGAQFWVPDRSDWEWNPDGTIRSSSSVEFRVNEPFLNEGGYVRLAAQGVDSQYASIEQDIFNVANHSNGNNFGDAVGDKLEPTQDRLSWFPNNKWLEEQGGVQNIKIVELVTQEDESILRVETIPNNGTYVIHYDVPRIEFQSGIIPAEAWVEADYVYRANVWFKNHNASMLVAIENSSSRNFNTFFEVEEFVPKFITMDALDTAPFNYEPILKPGTTNGHFRGLQYSHKTNRAHHADVVASATPVSGMPHNVVDGNPTSNEYLELPAGKQSVTIDLGGKYMVTNLKVWHFWQDKRTYHETKTEVSEDGINWVTVFDSVVDGEYMEMEHGHEIKFWAYEDKPKDYSDNYLQAKIVRYVRDWTNGNTVNTGNHWAEIQVFADWQLEEQYTYATGSAYEGQQLATNGKGLVTTDVSGASVTIDLQIDFTSWWYMTYLVGPQFGSFDVEMPTVMGGSHVLPLDNPYVNKVAHRHIMSWPPGKHQAVIKQRSGKVAIDRFRFEDYQYYDRSATRIPSTADASFTRYKIVPEQARDYVGTGNQSTYGPYDAPRLNPDTGQPDQSVPIKYRMRLRAVLDAAGGEEERGIAYTTSAIFEQGKLSSHWRPSAASDNTPGNRIEHWDPNQPHRTGIQWFHLANGSIRGTKILPSAIMDYHISPYARIGEYKLDLNYPTHQHGHYMMNADGTMYFFDNKHVLDSIHGWAGHGGMNGTKNTLARGDHSHNHFHHAVDIHGPIRALEHDAHQNPTHWYPINGVEIVGFKEDFDNHIAAADLHFSAAERNKLAGIATGATKVESSANGKIKINGTDITVYTHPSGDGNLHVPSTGTSNNGKYLKAGSTAGSLSWSLISWAEIQSKPATFTPPIATSSTLGGVKQGSGISIDASGTISWSHPTGDGNLHVPATGTGNNLRVLKAGATAGSVAWGQVQFSELGGSISTAQHGQMDGGSLHAVATGSLAGFMSAAHYTKLEGVETGANKYIHPTTHSLDMITETTGLKVMTAAERTKLAGIATNANNYVHPATHSLDVITETASKKIMTDVERTKLAGIEAGAINQATADARYLQQTGGGIADELIISSINDAKLVLNADTDNDANESGEARVILTQDGGIVGAEVKLSQSGVNNNAMVLAPFMDYNTANPVKNFNVFIHDKKIWHEGNLSKSEFATAGHTHPKATNAIDGLMSKEDYFKLSGIAAEANKYIHPDTHSLNMITETATLKVMTDAERTKLNGIATNANNYVHPVTHALDMITETAGLKIMTAAERTKLAGIATNANNYVHPSTHAASMIVEETDKRFMKDNERSKLEGIEESANNYSHPSTHSLAMITETVDKKVMTADERTKLAGIEANANNYSHPATHSLDIITETASKVIMTSAERTKLSGIATNANNYVHPSTHSIDMITETTGLKIMTAAERTKLSGIATNANNYAHPTGDGNLHVPATGTGNNAKVLKAGTTAGSLSWGQVDWDEITSKPSAYAPVVASTTSLGGVIVGSNLTIDGSGRLSAPAPYAHPTGDGNKHVPADGGSNANKVLKATSTAGTPVWGSVAYSELTGVPSSFTPSTHTHPMSAVTGLDAALNSKVNLSGNNTISGINTFTNAGVSVKIQPSTPVGANAVLFQINNSLGNSLVTMGANQVGQMVAKVVINGDLEVTGATVQKSTQDIQGDMNVTGNLNVTGDAVLGDDLSDRVTIKGDLVTLGETTLGAVNKGTTTKGDLRVEGNFIPVGRYLEVGRFPVYGIAGDPQFQTDGVGVFASIVEHISTFDVSGMSCLPPVSEGASRHYKVMISYSTSGTEDASFRITQGNGSTEIFSATLPAVNGGVLNKARTWMSIPFSTIHSGDTVFQARKNTSGALAIRYVEVIAVDYYS